MCEFIKIHDKNGCSIFVGKDHDTFESGWDRHQWLKGYFGKECSSASSALWEVLVERHGQPKLLVEDDGRFYVEDKEE